MNNKASRQQIQFPPLLNLADDHPHIDSSLKEFERQNGPYINNMIFPLYMQETDGPAVYDYKGSRYEVSSISGKSYIMKDGRRLAEISPKHFEREYIDLYEYLNYDIDDDYEEGEPTAYSRIDENNRVEFVYKDNTYLHEAIFAEGSIIKSRCRIMNGNAFWIIYFDEGDQGRFLYFRMKDDGSILADKIYDVNWLQNTIRTSTTASYNPTTIAIEDADPFITMCHVKDDIYGFSIISDYGKVLDTKRTGFITFIDNGSVLFYGTDILPETTAQTAEITTEDNAYFNVYGSKLMSETKNGAFLFKDGVYYDYTEEGVLGPELSFPVTYQPTPTIANYITIDGVDYDYGKYNYADTSQTITVASSERTLDWKFTVIWNANGTSYSSENNTSSPKTITATRRVYPTEEVADGFDPIILTWHDEDADITDKFGKGSFLLTYDDTSTQSVTWLVAPNVFIDIGKMYSLWSFGTNTSTWQYQLPVGSIIVEGATFGNLIDGKYSFTPLAYYTITNDSRCVRSNSFTVGQNFWQSHARLCNTASIVPSNVNVSTAESSNSKFMEYMNSNETDLIYFPGMVNSSSSSSDYFNYWLYATSATGDATAASTEDTLCWVPAGFRCSLNDTNWRLCYNTTASGTSTINGISYTEELHKMGTLVTPWTSIDVDHYVVANDHTVIYKEYSGNFVCVSIKEDATIKPLFNDKHIIFNTTSYWNAYDVDKNALRHYASDYNDRLFFGSPHVADEPAVNGTAAFARNTASAIGSFINSSNEVAYTSMLPAYVSRLRCDVSYAQLYDSVSPSTEDTQAVDVFFSNVNKTSAAPMYRFSIGPYLIPSEYIDPTIVGRTYAVSSVLLNPDILASYVDGQGNNDLVITGNTAYSLTYNSNQRMIMLYNPQTGTSNPRFDKPAAFFVLQGQYYGILDDKIYSLIYSNGIIAQRDAIVDIRGMQFIGNNPMIAFFWSPSLRSIYSFTGDANLQHLYYASKFSEVISKNNEYFYDESTQSIWVPTNNGLLVLGPKNTYMLEDFKNTSLVQISEDGLTHITDNDITYNSSYYPRDEFRPYTLNIESSFWGLGNTEVGSIDRFGITIYDVTHTNPDMDIIVGVRSITDITVKSEEKKIHISPNDWDKWSHAVLINYNPQLIQGQGIRLYIKSDAAIQQITAHVQDRKTSQLSSRSI